MATADAQASERTPNVAAGVCSAVKPTEEELQPNIDGLSFDEVPLLASLPGIIAALVTRHIARRRQPGGQGHHAPAAHALSPAIARRSSASSSSGSSSAISGPEGLATL